MVKILRFLMILANKRYLIVKIKKTCLRMLFSRAVVVKINTNGAPAGHNNLILALESTQRSENKH